MSDLNIVEKQVFVYHDDNGGEDATDLKSYLDEKGYKCLLHCETQEPGKQILSNLHGSISQNQRVILLITKETEEIGLLNFAVVSALEKVSLKTHMCVLIAYKGISVTENRVKSLKTGLLALTPNKFIDLNSEKGYESLLRELESTQCLAEDLPAGNLHHGLVYSHISGLMGYVVEELQQCLPSKCEAYRGKQQLLIDRFLLVIPETCGVPSTLVTADTPAAICISHVDEIAFKKLHAGKKRHYKVTIYKITKDKEEYYICAQVPTVLTAISQLAEKHLGKIDVALEQQRFHSLYQQILDVKGWNNIVKIVTCKDEANIASALFEAAKILATSNQLTNDQTENKLINSPTETVKTAVQESVYLKCFESDQKVGESITKMLCENNIPHFTIMLGKSVLEGGEKHKGWILFVLSKAALEDSVYTFTIMSFLQGDVDKCKLRIMLVLSGGLQMTDVPQCIKWVHFFRTEDQAYLNGILRTVSGTPVDISRALPAGDVIPGLSWAYAQNYLMKTLTDTLSNRIKCYLNQNNIECGCIKKLIIVWVKSCDTETWLTTVANKGDPMRQVEHLKKDLEETTDSFGGQIGRPFKLNVFKFTDTTNPNEKFERYFLAEYCTPMQCIRMMETEYAGMSSAAKEEQGPRFKEMLDEIMSRKTIQQIFRDNKVSLIYFDDLETSPERHLIDLLEEEIREPPTVIYHDGMESEIN